MKKVPFIIFSIILLSCNGNRNQSVRNQDIAEVDSTSIAIDTTTVPTMEENEDSKEPTKIKSSNPIVGTFYCTRSGDTYIFNENKTGMFIPKAESGAKYNWRLEGNTIIVTYSGKSAFLGTSKLKYDKDSNSFIEKSIAFGNLTFVKQNKC